MTEPPPAIDLERLAPWLRQHVAELGEPRAVRQFRGGLSNPTYLIDGADGCCVLRKQPPGELLPSAHAVDREYQVLDALRDTDMPVPRVIAMCTDRAVLGTLFYVMDYVPGRVFSDPALGACAAEERSEVYAALAKSLAVLHGIDHRKAGLAEYGRQEQYLARQVKRWKRQFDAAAVPSSEMESLAAWLAAHLPASDASGDGSTIVHGDYRLGNAIFDSHRPRVAAILDWELSTIGHPFSDLAYCCIAWRLPPEMRGLEGVDKPGLPDEAEFRRAYCEAAGRADLPGFEFFMAFAMFRLAAILAGVYRRAINGNAADSSAAEDAIRRFGAISRRAWRIATAA